MSSRLAAEFFAKGVDALSHDHFYLARVCFEQAVHEERTPAGCSYLALANAKSRGEFDEAIALAEEAISKEPENSVFYLNLGQIYLLAGLKKEALDTFRKGVQFERNAEIICELDAFAPRAPPLFPKLRRSHPLNRYLGKFLARLGLRRVRGGK
ncbi:MAG: hypothetical protein FD174_2662 [Geobacteraceae bacterium]|nr:MAG: hypothetical protein FD174_2662 [Geobacteraceae bacterium]